jgi:hypothetical protein
LPVTIGTRLTTAGRDMVSQKGCFGELREA